MAPKKKEVQKFSLGEFIQDTTYGGSWADEVEDTYASGTQPLPPSDRRGGGGGSSYSTGGYASLRDNLPQTLPTKPPYTAHLGNLSYDATVETVTEFFDGCNCVSVRIIEDREQNRPKGFAYAEFADLEGLKQALTFDGQSFQGRTIRIKIADPPKDRLDGRGGESNRDFSDWTRKGPLADLPRGNDRRGSGGDYSERRPLRDPAPADDGKVRDFGNWERRGPLSPLPQAERQEGSREGSRARTMETRSESFRNNRRASPSWGPGEGQQQGEGSRPPRREFAERQERVVSAADKDMQWRTSMRPDMAGKSPGQSREGSEAPPSPAAAPALPVGRPKLNLAKRTVSESPNVTSPALPSATESKASPFGAARPIDTAAREREIEEKRILAIQQKKEADEKAKEERRIAKEAAAKEAAEKEVADKETAEKEAAEKEAAAKEAAEQAAQQPAKDEPAAAANGADAASHDDEAAVTSQDGEQKGAARPREPRGEGALAPKSRAVESGNWRRGSGEQRGGSRGGAQIPSGPRRGGGAPRGPRGDGGRGGGRVNGSGAGPARQSQPASGDAPGTPTTDEDGWTTVPGKNRRGQSTRAPVSS